MKPSTALSGAAPARNAASAARHTSTGSSNPAFIEVEISAWNSSGSPVFIVSCQSPNCGSR